MSTMARPKLRNLRKNTAETQRDIQFRFSGHETFACRFAWLPKAARLLREEPQSWSDDDRAMVLLGVGKNMVRSLRFWANAMGVVSIAGSRTPAITEFGELIFGTRGLDPYIEHPATPWLLHWKLTSNETVPLFSWHHMFNRWPYPEFTRTDVINAFRRESGLLGFDHSDVTLSQHFDAFLHTYMPSRISANLEDSLDGPLTDLGLLQAVGDKRGDGGRRETVYAFRRGRKPEISQPLFDYAIDDYWNTRRPDEATLSLREISVGLGSPGRIFLLGEEDVHLRLEDWNRATSRSFDYLPSAIAGRIVRLGKRASSAQLLRKVYGA